jgi:hypothetical protein
MQKKRLRTYASSLYIFAQGPLSALTGSATRIKAAGSFGSGLLRAFILILWIILGLVLIAGLVVVCVAGGLSAFAFGLWAGAACGRNVGAFDSFAVDGRVRIGSARIVARVRASAAGIQQQSGR